MNRFENMMKKIAKKNILVRVIMVLYYAVFFSLRNLSRYLLINNGKALACILVVVLVIPKMFMVIANAEETGMTLSVGDVQVSADNSLSQVTGGDSLGRVSGGDNSGQVSGGDSSSQVSGGDNSGQVSGGDVEQTPEEAPEQTPGEVPEQTPEQTPEYEQEAPGADTNVNLVSVQQIEAIYDNMYAVGELQVGSVHSRLVIRPIALEKIEKNYVNPLVGLYYGFNGQEYYADCTEEGITVSIPYEYFGNFYCYGVDANGNSSNRISMQLMIDSVAPAISWEEVEINDVRYMRIVVQDVGNVFSGVDFSSCFIYGVPAENIDIIEEEIAENIFGQAVVSRITLDVSLENMDAVNIELSVSDYVGNISTDILEWSSETKEEQSQILSVSVPCSIPFVISTWKTDKQISSEQLAIVNNSECDIYLKFTNVNIAINKDNVEDNPELKDCKIYLETEDGVRYSLPEGDSGEVSIVRIPGKNSEDTDNTYTFFIDGYIHPDSDEYWRDGDVFISISVSFWGIEPEESEEETQKH